MNVISFIFNNTTRGSNDDMDCQCHRTPNVDFSAGEQDIFGSATTVSDKIE